MDEYEVVVNFLATSAHLREIGAAVTLCGIPVAGWFLRRFVFITQVGGKGGCKDCRNKFTNRYMRQKENR